MPFSFPASPSVGDTSTQNGRTYSWSGYAWEIVATPAALPASVITSGTLDIARIPTGTSSSTVCVGNDSRLSDSRTPTSHTHGNITNAGAIGSTADQFVVTTTSGVLTAVSAATARTTLSVQPTASPAFTGTASFGASVSVGTSTPTFVNANYSGVHIHAATATSLKLTNATTGQTATDGFELLQDASGNAYVWNRESTNLQFGTGSNPRLTISSTGTATFSGQIVGQAGAVLTGTVADNVRQLRMPPSGTTRWEVGPGFDAESGSNVGSTFWITRWSDSGVFLGTPIAIARATGVVTLENQLLVSAGSGSAGSYAPGIAISGDPDTGIQQMSGLTNTLSVVTAGNERLRVGSGGRFTFFANSEKYGIQLNNGATANGPFIGSDGADIFTISTAGGAERVRVDASGNVGIGTAGGSNESGFMFHVAGNAFFTSGPNATTKISIDSGDQRLVLGAYYQFGVAAYSFIAATNNAETGNTDLQLRTGTTARMTIAANGNVGIGIAPSTQLHVGSLGVFRLQTGSVTMDCTPTAGALDGFVWNTNPASYYQWNTGGTQRLLIGSDGKITCKGLYDNTVGATNRDVFVDSGGVVGYVSSIRESKTDIVTLDDVSWLSALSPVSYRYRKRNADGTYSDEADGVIDYGLIAEDVEAVRPELCFYDQVDGDPQLRGVTYSKLITPMLRYIQQLEARIAALEERING